MQEQLEEIVIGSLDPIREWQDSQRVFDVKGLCPTLRARDYKGAVKIMEIKPKMIILGDLGVGGERGIVYSTKGIAGALSATQYKDATKIMEEPKPIGFIDHGTGKHQSNTVFDTNGIAPSVTTIDGGTQQIKIMEDKTMIIGGLQEHQSWQTDISPCINSAAGMGGGQTPCIAEPQVIQKVGDRGTDNYSIHDYANCLSCSPMSDREQMLVEPKVNVVGNYNESGHDASRVVDVNGIAPTIKENHGTVTGIIEPKVKVIGQMDNSIDHTHESANRVYDTAGVSPCLNTCGGGGLQPKIVDDTYENRDPRAYDDVAPAIRAEREGFKVVASRGRNPDNPNDRRSGIELEQRLEINEEDIANTLTSLTKDNMLLENLYDVYNDRLRTDGCSGTITQNCTGKGSGVQYTFEDMTEEPIRVRQATESRYRIRKLTERECFRLMGFTDEEFDKAASVNSRSQLYKQAGNSIVVDVLVAIFGEIINADGTVNTHSGEQLDLFGLFSGE